MPGKLLPDAKLEELTRSGKTDPEILVWLAENENITVTRQAISAWRKRRGMNMRPASPQRMPWTLKPEHARQEPARAIRWYARREAQLPLAPRDAERLDRVIEHLNAVHGVFFYNPDTPQGWFIVERRDGVDKGIIREPRG